MTSSASLTTSLWYRNPIYHKDPVLFFLKLNYYMNIYYFSLNLVIKNYFFKKTGLEEVTNSLKPCKIKKKIKSKESETCSSQEEEFITAGWDCLHDFILF